MALIIKLEGNWGSGRFGEDLGGGSAVLRGCLGRGRDHQKLETKPRSLQDNYQD